MLGRLHSGRPIALEPCTLASSHAADKRVLSTPSLQARLRANGDLTKCGRSLVFVMALALGMERQASGA
jgi:hypothetical protein